MNGIKRFGSALVIMFLSFIAITNCSSKYGAAKDLSIVATDSGDNLSEDSLGAGQPENEYFKTWEGGKWQLDGANFIPVEMYDSLAKVDPDFKKYLEVMESLRKYRENHQDNSSDNPLKDSLGVRRPASEYFPQTWDGGKVQPGRSYNIPPDLEDSMAKVNPMYKEYLEWKQEVRKKHLESKSDSISPAKTDTTASH